MWKTPQFAYTDFFSITTLLLHTSSFTRLRAKMNGDRITAKIIAGSNCPDSAKMKGNKISKIMYRNFFIILVLVI